MSHDDEPTRSTDAPRDRRDETSREMLEEARLWRQRPEGRRPGDIEDPEVPKEPVNDSKTDLPDPGDPEVELSDEEG